ncbi:MAG: hypothetical protein M1371_01360 [Actinobacteria bacterium]|nr:hypothetical protein [Actinomycetota bacterium]
MNARERFLACMKFDRSVRALKWEFGYWGGTIERWYREGLPEQLGLAKQVAYGDCVCGEGLDGPLQDLVRDKDVHDFFCFDEGERTVPINFWIYPPFKEQVLEEDETTRVVIDDNGVKKQEKKDKSTIPKCLSWPVKDKESWEIIKTERFQIMTNERLPYSWRTLKEEYIYREYPLSLGGSNPVGFFGSLRNLLGEVNLLYAFYDQPQLIREIMNYLTDFWISLFEEVLSQVEVDYAKIWEDMAFKNGPLISPQLVREFMLPCYKKLTNFLRNHGVEIILLDSDGDCRSLIPIWIEGGITGIYPNEVQASMDILEIRKTYPSLQLLGGIDKMVIANDKQQIDIELKSKVASVLEQSGYIPFVDHLIPPGVSWDNFRYYRERLHQLLDPQPTRT